MKYDFVLDHTEICIVLHLHLHLHELHFKDPLFKLCQIEYESGQYSTI